MVETAGTTETSVNFYQTIRRNNPEDSHLHTRRRENLKSHKSFETSNLWPFGKKNTKITIKMQKMHFLRVVAGYQ
jgi:hypothetical protein